MSEFKVGDLVCVVKPAPCCGDMSELGKVFVIRELLFGQSYCFNCGCNEDELDAFYDEENGVSVETIIKISPPSLDETTEQEKDLEI